MKLLYSFLLGLTLMVGAQAQTVFTGTSSNFLFHADNAASIRTFSATVPTGSTTVTFYDAPSTNATYVLAAYTNYIASVTNEVTSLTNYYGVVYNWTNLVLVNIPVAVPQTTNFYPILGMTTVTTSPQVVNFSGAPRAFRGVLGVAQSTNVVTYTAVVGY